MPRARQRPTSKVSKEDAELAEAAKAKAGSIKNLARRFENLSLAAVSEWGRTRNIPRHVRPALKAYVYGDGRPEGTWEEFPGILRGLEYLKARNRFDLIGAIETIVKSCEAAGELSA
jgi:hypothetical protein